MLPIRIQATLWNRKQREQEGMQDLRKEVSQNQQYWFKYEITNTKSGWTSSPEQICAWSWVLCIHNVFSFKVSMGFLVIWTCGSLILMACLGLFLFSLLPLSSFKAIFDVSYFILYKPVCFLNRDIKGLDLVGGVIRGIGRIKGRGKHDHAILYEKKYTFNDRGN